MSAFKKWLLYRLLAKEIGVTADADTSIEELSVNEYTLISFRNNDIQTVREGVMAWALHAPTPGIGNKSWEDFINAIK